MRSFVGEKIETSDWFSKGLSESNKVFCIQCLSPVSKEKLDQVRQMMSLKWKTILRTIGSSLFECFAFCW